MLIMPSTDVNFQALAENITSDFFTNGVPLSDGVVKTAKEHSFTPEEVTRLVEKTNTAASLHLLKTADDKKGTFALAHVDLVLQQTHPGEKEEVEKTASVYTGLPHRKKATHATLEKAASEVASCLPKTASSTSDTDAMQALFVVRKALDEKKLEKTALELKLQDKLDYLVSEFSVSNGPDFHKFAAECQYLYGNKALPVLSGMARYLNTPLRKTAADIAYVDDRTPHMQAMSEICSGLGSMLKIGSEINELESVLGKIWSGLKKFAARQALAV